MLDITCGNDYTQQCLMLDTYIVTMHNAREEFYNNQVLIKLNIIPHSTKHPDFANPKAPS